MNSIVQQKKSKYSVKELVIISFLAAMSYVLMLFHLPYKYLGFLEMEFSDIPAVFAALQFGPLAGVFIELIKNVIKAISASTTAGVGELANFIISIAYIIPVGVIYQMWKKHSHRNHNNGNTLGTELSDKKNILLLIVMFISGTLSMCVVGALINYFVTIPLYAKAFGGVDNVVNFAQSASPIFKLGDLKALVLIGITPFNVVKGFAMSLIGYYTYSFLKNRV